MSGKGKWEMGTRERVREMGEVEKVRAMSKRKIVTVQAHRRMSRGVVSDGVAAMVMKESGGVGFV